MSKSLAIITVVYQNYDVLGDFFRTLDDQTDKDFQVFLTDLTPAPKNYSYPSYVVHASSINKGFAHGVNIGVKKAVEKDFEFLCIVNNDIYFQSDFVEKARNSLVANSHAVIGGKIYYAPGFEYHKDRYSKKDLGKVLWYAGGTIDWRYGTTPHRGVDEVDKGQYDSTSQVNFVTGCLICFDKSVADVVGEWDESYFLYYEDSDFCVRASKKGVSIIYDPTLVIWHKNAQSTKGPGSRLHQRYQEKNKLRFGLKYAPLKTKLHLMKNYFFSSS